VQKANPTLRHDLPPWVLVVDALALSVVHGVVPFGVSRLSSRYGWSAGHPAWWNLFGLLPVVAGLALIVSIIVLHGRAAVQHGWRIEATPFEPTQYLIFSGPYRYTRNPIYLCHFAIWFGWALFYGSVAILVGLLLMWLSLTFVIVPYEERGLMRQHGESYRRYQKQVARWFGRPRAAPPRL